MKCRLLALLIGAASLTVCADKACAQPSYAFRNIADSSEFTNLRGGAINDHGTVAFAGKKADGSTGVYTGSGGSLTTIADATSGFVQFGDPSINDSGVAAFVGEYAGSKLGVFTGSGGGLQTVVAPGGPDIPGWTPSINNAGTVAYWAFTAPFTYGIYTSAGGAKTTIATSIGTLRDFGSPRINEAGAVAFYANLHAVNRVGYYYRRPGQALETVYQGPGVYEGPHITPGLSDDGEVAFLHPTSPQGYGVYTWSAGQPTLAITNTSNAFYRFNHNFDINSAGQIAFHAELDDDRLGIYTGGDPLLDKVIETGDELFGSTLSGLAFSPQINERGDVAFYYVLENGTFGIAVAAAVPEPSGAVMMSAAVMMLAGRRGRSSLARYAGRTSRWIPT